ncbi:hypothetical protein KSP40_PGU021424 [Platanthera guangdongensis]|uniref:RNase H type-1 domain-containing protein n=1 Tax=Platanthera guangdongensis TaxID=2320717 RepID=A0ABR2M4D4_9ASPA
MRMTEQRKDDEVVDVVPMEPISASDPFSTRPLPGGVFCATEEPRQQQRHVKPPVYGTGLHIAAPSRTSKFKNKQLTLRLREREAGNLWWNKPLSAKILGNKRRKSTSGAQLQDRPPRVCHSHLYCDVGVGVRFSIGDLPHPGELGNHPALPAVFYPVVPPPPPPRPGWLKINIDGALFPSRHAGVGIVARDSSSTVLFAVGRLLSQWDPGRTEMEVLAGIRDYLTVDCFDASWVIIEGDYLNLIKYCQRCFDSRLWDAHFPDADVLGFLFELPRVLLRHVPRAANWAADVCPRYAISHTFQWTCSEDFPPVLSEVVQRNRENISARSLGHDVCLSLSSSRKRRRPGRKAVKSIRDLQ